MFVQGLQQTVDQDTRQIHKGETPWMCGRQNVRATAGDNTEQNTKDTPSSRIQTKTSDSARNRTPVTELGGRNTTNHATVTDADSFPVV